ncbi:MULTISPECIES: SDR family oxidoreductase [unclassified Novosphingobium]|uniref:SDR family NAD(P)-dependent oxidoreductase n=1 Tax=unclassified Novosphingobium TaxID=2644732 RepID=UPI00146E9A5B|nr:MULTISPECIES: SDR family oxidoreductase [unclassified Novosphingobium]NMN05967.1 NAD(P)-dependent dehydrogenase (short-subunit alcohol dehydrogenase family) [Novosphingobium sp. SG919]NMN88263.1 NAD(P)-dependent dehydrogenase (short-subunit alcohol dehydrogenase family) [Novosphingobium sp. SG916]
MTMFDLTGKVALVTGSTRGIGRAIAQAMIAAGARVVISSENAADTKNVAAELGQLGVVCDVSDPAQLATLVDRTVAEHGSLDILVCNAGVPEQFGSFADMDIEEYERVIGINLTSQVLLTKLALPHLIERQGNVIFTASLSGLRGNGGINAYALAKAALAQLARNLAVQLGPKGVRANALSPGVIATELSRSLLDNHAVRDRRMALTPLRRPGTPAEVAGAAVFLASPAGGFVTGHNLVVDGGTLITDGS